MMMSDRKLAIIAMFVPQSLAVLRGGANPMAAGNEWIVDDFCIYGAYGTNVSNMTFWRETVVSQIHIVGECIAKNVGDDEEDDREPDFIDHADEDLEKQYKRAKVCETKTSSEMCEPTKGCLWTGHLDYSFKEPAIKFGEENANLIDISIPQMTGANKHSYFINATVNNSEYSSYPTRGRLQSVFRGSGMDLKEFLEWVKALGLSPEKFTIPASESKASFEEILTMKQIYFLGQFHMATGSCVDDEFGFGSGLHIPDPDNNNINCLCEWFLTQQNNDAEMKKYGKEEVTKDTERIPFEDGHEHQREKGINGPWWQR